MISTRPRSPRASRKRLAGLLAAVLAAVALTAACSSSKESAETTTTTSAGSGQQIEVGGYTFTMNVETNPADLPFPEGTFVEVQGFDITKDGSTIMTAYSTTLPPGQVADAATVDKLLTSAGATNPEPGDVRGQPFTSATLPDGRVLILAASGQQVAVAVGDNLEQMVKALNDTAQASPESTEQAPSGNDVQPPN